MPTTIYFQPEKVLVRKTGNFPLASYDDEQFYTDQSIYNLYKKRNYNFDLGYPALLNSRLLNYYFQHKMVTNPDVFPYIKGIHLKRCHLRIPSVKRGLLIHKLVPPKLLLPRRNL